MQEDFRYDSDEDLDDDNAPIRHMQQERDRANLISATKEIPCKTPSHINDDNFAPREQRK